MKFLDRKYCKIVCVIILLLYSIKLFAQEPTYVIEDYLSKCQYQKALDYLEQRVDTTKEANLQKVLCFSYLQNYSRAIEILLHLKIKYPSDIQIITQLASCYNKLAMLKESIECFDELIKMYPENAYFIIQKADLLYQSNQYNEAIQNYKYAFNEHTSSYLPKQIAYCFGKIQQWDSAKIYIEYALKIDSIDEKAKIELLKIMINQKNYLPALELSNQFLSKDSNNISINNLKLLLTPANTIQRYSTPSILPED
jgi:tetratricopeptide (TPR) repeat protein